MPNFSIIALSIYYNSRISMFEVNNSCVVFDDEMLYHIEKVRETKKWHIFEQSSIFHGNMTLHKSLHKRVNKLDQF